ncbi:hypothetical protein CFP56_019140 [Quercus suber]|uniref:DUF4283 domain-containing protein n=1 Tax=Quercus suber TaxID=58331 RepID=A0AAW0LZX8_QUESU
MADDVTRIMEKMKLTVEEEEVIEILEEGRKEGMESCALSLIGKFLTCRSFNRKAAITTLKRAWGLEEGVQMIEVGTNLFQLKFQTEFEMDRVFKGGPWSFDNQVLLLVCWKAGMTADNVRFDSVSLWAQIWGTPFDMVSPKIAETVGSRLGSVVEVEKKQRLEDAGVEFAWRKDRSGKVSQEATGDGGVAVQNPREQDKKRKEGNCDKQGTILEGAHVAMDITGCVEIFTEDMGSAVAAVQNSKKRDVVEVDGSMHRYLFKPYIKKFKSRKTLYISLL